MKQRVVIVASDEGMEALAPDLAEANGVAYEHLIEPEKAVGCLKDSPAELLVLVHPLPHQDTISFCLQLKGEIGDGEMPLTVVVASPAELLALESLQSPGVRLARLGGASGSTNSTLSDFLRKAPRPHARVMVKVAIEMGAGKILRIAQTVNVSRSGLLIRTRERFPPGSSLDLRIELPGEKMPVEARAEVVRWTDPTFEEVRGLGARFVWFRGRDEERFEEFMRRAVSST